MEPKRIRNLRLPAYPTRLEVLDNPDILRRHLPPGWLRTAEAAGAVGFFLAVNGVVLAGDKPGPMTDDRTAIAAPIFKHGEGRGSIGSDTVAPPTYLSEEEALQIVTEELSKSGVKIKKKDVVIGGVLIPDAKKPEAKATKANADVPLKADGFDPDRKIAVEFISEPECFVRSGPSGLLETFDLRATAEAVAKAVREKGKGMYFGTFYDPMAGYAAYSRNVVTAEEWKKAENDPALRKELEARLEKAGKEVRDKATAESKALLRLQVKDFADWLKAQGAI